MSGLLQMDNETSDISFEDPRRWWESKYFIRFGEMISTFLKQQNVSDWGDMSVDQLSPATIIEIHRNVCCTAPGDSANIFGTFFVRLQTHLRK